MSKKTHIYALFIVLLVAVNVNLFHIHPLMPNYNLAKWEAIVALLFSPLCIYFVWNDPDLEN